MRVGGECRCREGACRKLKEQEDAQAVPCSSSWRWWACQVQQAGSGQQPAPVIQCPPVYRPAVPQLEWRMSGNRAPLGMLFHAGAVGRGAGDGSDLSISALCWLVVAHHLLGCAASFPCATHTSGSPSPCPLHRAPALPPAAPRPTKCRPAVGASPCGGAAPVH